MRSMTRGKSLHGKWLRGKSFVPTVSEFRAARRLRALLLAVAAAHCTGANAQAPPPAPAPAAASGAGSTWTIPSNEKITALLAERMKHNGVGIVIGVIEPAGQRLVTYGKSGAKNGRPLDGDTVFQTGSLTKTFTGLLLAEMVTRGEVKLEDPAAQYLPQGVRISSTGAANARPITLHHLGTHTSGFPSMPNNFDPKGEPNPVEAYTVDDLFQFVSTYRLPREPGDKLAYSNLGFSLLGHLLARKAGMDFEALVKERVLNPLGMTSTSITLTPDQMARLAPGHNRYLQPQEVWEMNALQASGSMRSTANDLLRFVSAYLGYRDTALKAAMQFQITPRIPPNAPRPLMLGWGARKSGDRWIYLKDGGKSGYRCAAVFSLATRTGVVALANSRTDDHPQEIAYYLMTGQPLAPAPSAPEPRKVVAVDRAVLESYAGRYEEKPGTWFDVVSKGDRLLVTESGDGGALFDPVSARDFYLASSTDEVSFELDEKGHATSLRYYPEGRQGAEVHAARRIGK